MITRRVFTASAALAAPAYAARAQSGAPAKIIFPFAPGGGGDALARLIAEQAAQALGRPFIVENRTGADGRIGIQAVKAAAPDGQTLLLTTGPTMWLMALVHKSPGYDPVKDFEPVSLVAEFEFCIAVANNTGVQSMADLERWVKTNPGKATYGLPSLGTLPHFMGLALSKSFGADMERLPYRGSAPVVRDLIGGQIPIGIVTVADALPQHKAGLLKILAVPSEQRSPFLPDVPTLRESGHAVSATSWYGLWAPAGTPASALRPLSEAVNGALAKPEIRARLQSFGMISIGATPERLAAAMRDAAAEWGTVIRESGYSIDQ